MSRAVESKDTFPFIQKAANDLDDEDKAEVDQRLSALIATIACDLPRHALKEGSRLAAIALKPKVVTKYEYNQNRVRDFRVCKEGEGAAAIGEVPDDEITPSSFDPYPPAFTREYCRAAFQGGAKLLHQKLWSFQFVRLIDMSELLIGDDGFIQLCDGLEKCPVHTLILTNNRISDKGLLRFSEMWRSMAQLDTLKLANNRFTDKGIEQMFHPTRYSPSLRAIDLSKNRIGVRTAFYLGLMFVNERCAQLEDISIGVRVGSLSHGDSFVAVLVALLTAPNARPVRRLDLSDVGLSDEGVAAVASLVACSDGLKELYLSRNYITPVMRSLMYRALVVNKSITVFRYYYCGFNDYEEVRIKRLRHSNVEGMEGKVPNVMPHMSDRHVAGSRDVTAKYQRRLQSGPDVGRPSLSWSEIVGLCTVVSRTLYTCTTQMRKVLEGVSHTDVPPPLKGNQMFATEARGKLTVLQQISLFGRRSLKATPLRDELDAIKYVTIRPVPVTFKKAMYLLHEIEKMTAHAEDSLEENSAESRDAASRAVYKTIEVGPQLYTKLIYGDIILLEKWLTYLQTLHLGRAVSFPPRFEGPAALEAELRRQFDRAGTVTASRLEAIRIISAEFMSADSVVDILMEQTKAQQQVLPPSVTEADVADDESVHSLGMSSLGDMSAAQNALSAVKSPATRNSKSRSAAISSNLSRSATKSRSNDPPTTTSATSAPPENPLLAGYAFLWAHRKVIFPIDPDSLQQAYERIEVLEGAAMGMEDYASALREQLEVCERLIAVNMRDSITASQPDMDFKNDLRLPFYNSIGLPSFYVYKCLVELLKRNKNSTNNDVYSQTESTQASTCLDIQLKRKKKESRKQRKIVGRRFDVFTKSQKARYVEEDFIDGESLTIGSLGTGDSTTESVNPL